MHDAVAERKGRRLLKELLPLARAMFRKSGAHAEHLSALGKGISLHLREQNLDKVMIYPAPLGGWHADVVLKRVPPGVMNVIGTPVGSPCKTREEAVSAAIGLLLYVVSMESQNKGGRGEDSRVFELHGFSFSLPPELLDAFAVFQAAKYPSEEIARHRLDETVGELFGSGDGMTAEALDKLVSVDYARLVSVMVMSALTGVIRHPLLEDAAPALDSVSSPKRKLKEYVSRSTEEYFGEVLKAFETTQEAAPKRLSGIFEKVK